jgi:hypothetical protein
MYTQEEHQLAIDRIRAFAGLLPWDSTYTVPRMVQVFALRLEKELPKDWKFYVNSQYGLVDIIFRGQIQIRITYEEIRTNIVHCLDGVQKLVKTAKVYEDYAI